jgi:hypothetical protein
MKKVLNGNKDGNGFDKRPQPTPAQKSAGWDKKRRGQELVRLILSLPFKGGDGLLKAKIAEYFGIDENDISIEEMILLKQAEKAIKTGNTRSAELLLDRAYGKPRQESDINYNDNKPIIIDFTGTDTGNNNGELKNTLRTLIRIPASVAKETP